jgi:signal transduction histidine kinase
VKHIMAAHKGKIEVQSRIGEGSTFSLIFPLLNNSIRSTFELENES